MTTQGPALAVDLWGVERAQPSAGPAVRRGLLACLAASAAAVVLCLPAPASAATAPDVTITDGPQAVSASQELVAGTVNPRGLTTHFYVAYAASGGPWCTNGSGTHSKTSEVQLDSTDSAAHGVSVSVTGLTGGTSYCAELVAYNSGGTTVGKDVNGHTQIPFTAGLPVAHTTDATATGPQQAVLDGTVDPAGQSTTYSVVYDISGSTWCDSQGQQGSPSYETAATALTPQDTIAHAVTVDLAASQSTPVTPGTAYCAAIAASNGSSSAAGSEVIGDITTFTTLPAVVSQSVKSIGATSAQVAGTVNPDGVATSYYAAYATVDSDWCQGQAGGPAPSETTPQPLSAQDYSAHAVTVDISGLISGKTYCVELRSSNDPLQESDGGHLPDPQDPNAQQFTVGLPTATTADATVDHPTTAVVDGTVAPAGQTTTYEVVYDLATTNWCKSDGAQEAPSQHGDPITLPQTDSGTYTVSAPVKGLTPGVRYCAAIAAHNDSNGKSGSPSLSIGLKPETFVAGLAPAAGSAQANDVTATSTVVSGTVNGEADQTAKYHVAYAAIGQTWCSGFVGAPDGTTTATSVSSPADASDHPVAVTVAGLTKGASYCAALVVTNATGTVIGAATQFTAGLPDATASTATPQSPTAMTVTGTITTTSQTDTTYYVAYDTASSPWCTVGGDPASASFHTSSTPLAAGDDTAHAVSVVVNQHLAPGQAYCAQMVARNGSGTSASPAQSFTAGFPFTVTTADTAAVTGSSVTVGGTVNPAGLPTRYWVAYDLAGSPWCSSSGQSGLPATTTDPVTLPATDTSDHAVRVSVGGLTEGTGYCAALVAANDMGTQTATPLALSTTPTPSDGGGDSGSGSGSGDTGSTGDGGGSSSDSGSAIAPTVAPPSQLTIRRASASSPSNARVTATVDPGGQSTSYHAAYGPASSPFCVSGGAGTPAATTSPVAMSDTDSGAHDVSVSLTHLTAATRYCVQIVATNASGTAASPIAVVTTVGPPSLRGLRLSPASFSVVGSRTAHTGRATGTHIAFHASRAGTVTVTVAREPAVHAWACRRAAGRCGAGGGATLGRFTHSVRSGANRLAFNGRLAGKALAPGRYQLQMVATDRWKLHSAVATAAFIVK